VSEEGLGNRRGSPPEKNSLATPRGVSRISAEERRSQKRNLGGLSAGGGIKKEVLSRSMKKHTYTLIARQHLEMKGMEGRKKVRALPTPLIADSRLNRAWKGGSEGFLGGKRGVEAVRSLARSNRVEL